MLLWLHSNWVDGHEKSGQIRYNWLILGHVGHEICTTKVQRGSMRWNSVISVKFRSCRFDYIPIWVDGHEKSGQIRYNWLILGHVGHEICTTKVQRGSMRWNSVISVKFRSCRFDYIPIWVDGHEKPGQIRCNWVTLGHVGHEEVQRHQTR